MGVGRQSLYTSRTSSGISTHLSVLTSCMMSAMGKSGARASGPMGCLVPGCSGGSGLLGMSCTMLYHFSGISCSVKTILRCFIGMDFCLVWK